MPIDAKTETLGFQSEAKQLLKLMIHSLYSNKEIFLRELVSNATDAIDRLRFQAISEPALAAKNGEFRIRIELGTESQASKTSKKSTGKTTSPKKGAKKSKKKNRSTLTVSDNGIGMTREEAISNLGTIAKSGTTQFLESLTGDQQKDAQLIGQFGVGFYSSFIVADKVVVETRAAHSPPEEGVRWSSSGEADFEIETITREEPGTSVTLYLKSGESDFADAWRVRSIVKKYADHVSVPVIMQKSEPGDESESEEDEVLNTATALWTRSRGDISDEEYQEFYKHVSHDIQDPLIWSHNKVEGKLDYTSLLYIPSKAPFDLWYRESPRGLKLYVQRVFIMDEADQFLPLYLRFVRGVVDSSDLSLNISREILQSNATIDSMRTALTKRVLDMIAKLATKQSEKYQEFWNEFGQVLKEGPAEDFTNKEKIAKLLRFTTTVSEQAIQDQSLRDYIGRMQPEQKNIYYVAAENYHTAANSPHLEIFRKQGIEVLLLHDRIDEWLVNHLVEFDSKQFQDIARGALDLGGLEDTQTLDAKKNVEKESEDLMKRIKTLLGDRVEEVRVTHRLTDSPACLVVGEDAMGMQMRRILESAGQAVPAIKRTFEINPGHPLVAKLGAESDGDRFNDLTLVLFDQAKLAEGTQLEEPTSYVARLNKLLLELAE